jgi:hypothetical protein
MRQRLRAQSSRNIMGTGRESAASSTRTGDTDQMQTDYLVTVWYEGEPKKTCGQKISVAVKFKLGPSVPTTALP